MMTTFGLANIQPKFPPGSPCQKRSESQEVICGSCLTVVLLLLEVSNFEIPAVRICPILPLIVDKRCNKRPRKDANSPDDARFLPTRTPTSFRIFSTRPGLGSRPNNSGSPSLMDASSVPKKTIDDECLWCFVGSRRKPSHSNNSFRQSDSLGHDPTSSATLTSS